MAFSFFSFLEILFIQYLTILAVSKPHGVITFFNLHNTKTSLSHVSQIPKNVQFVFYDTLYDSS